MLIFSVGGASEQLLRLDGPGIEVLAVGTTGRRVSVDDDWWWAEGLGLCSSSMEKMLEFVMVDWVGRKRRAVSSQPRPSLCPMALSPARSYAHSSHLVNRHEPAPGPVRNTGQGLKGLPGSFHLV